MILSGKTVERLGIITPCLPRTRHENGTSYGLSFCGYDIRLGKRVALKAGRTSLAVSMERFNLPKDVVGNVCDKSSLARLGIFVHNTILEPGWFGWLTLEISYVPLVRAIKMVATLEAGIPIAQVVFSQIDEVTDGYEGQYQDQPDVPVGSQARITFGC